MSIYEVRQLPAPAGSASEPSVAFLGDSNTGIYSPGADQVAISTSGTGQLFVDASGNVGIGSTATPTAARLLDVDGGPLQSLLLLRASTTTAATTQYALDPANSLVSLISSDWPVRCYINGSERVRVTSDGKVGVGTSSPGTRLEVFNTGTYGIAFQPSIYITNSSSGGTASANTGLGAIAWATDNNATLVSSIEAIRENPSVGAASALAFRTGSSGGGTERVRITSDGRIAFGGQGAPYSGATCDTYNNVSGEFAQAFRQDNATGFGIGIGIDGTYLAYFYPNKDLSGAPVGSISQNGTATAYNTSSDYRLKENINAVTDGITRLQQLKPSRFNFIADPYKTVDGFIAHEVQAVVPEAINGEKDAVDDNGNPIYQGIDQSKLVPLLTAALQEAIGRIETLEAEVAALKAQ